MSKIKKKTVKTAKNGGNTKRKIVKKGHEMMKQ